jgi:hypothetical protein
VGLGQRQASVICDRLAEHGVIKIQRCDNGAWPWFYVEEWSGRKEWFFESGGPSNKNPFEDLEKKRREVKIEERQQTQNLTDEERVIPMEQTTEQKKQAFEEERKARLERLEAAAKKQREAEERQRRDEREQRRREEEAADERMIAMFRKNGLNK